MSSRVTILAGLAALVAAVLWAAGGGPEGDDLEARAATARGGERVELLLELAAALSTAEPERAHQVLEEALQEAEEAGDARLEGRAHFGLGEAALNAERFEEALARFDTARRAFEAVGDRRELARALRRLGDAEYYLARFDVSLGHYMAARRLVVELVETGSGEMRVHLAHLATVIGNVLHRTGEPDRALAYYREALAGYREAGEEVSAAGASLNIGNIFQEQDDPESALDAFGEAREVAQSAGNDYLLSIALSNMASALVDLGRPGESIAPLAESYAIWVRTGRDLGRLHNQLTLGRARMALGEAEQAVEAYQLAVELGHAIDARKQLAEAYLGLAGATEAMGRTGDALHALQQHLELQREIADSELRQRVGELEVAHRVEASRHELELMKERQQRAALKGRILLAALGMAVAAALLLLAVLRAKARTAERLADAYRRVDELARTDELTGLPNRRGILERLELERARASRSGRSIVLALADLDGFKRVNDELGHTCGDRALRELAALLRRSVRAQDFVGRWGGDEFLMMFPDIDLEGGAVVADKIRREIGAAELDCGECTVRLTLCCGVVAGAADRTADDLLTEADHALRRAKEGGRDRVESGG